MQINKRLFGTMIFAVAAFAAQLGATEVQTTSYDAWLGTANGGSAEWDFNIPDSSYDTSAGYNLNVGNYGPINVTGPDGSGYDLTANSNYGNSGNPTLQGPSDGTGSMTFVTPSGGLDAFALGIGLTGNASTVTLTLSDGETFTFQPTVGDSLFEGFSSESPITGFVLTTGAGSQVQLTDFYAGEPTSEVATALMIGTGLFFFGAWRRVFSNLSTPRHKRLSISPKPKSARLPSEDPSKMRVSFAPVD